MHRPHPILHPRQSGFSLVELSIVVSIIALIIGAIVAGQELIGASIIRSQIAQIERFNTAANAFRLKYGYLPGDIPEPYATKFGFAARGTTQGQGDGNGIIEGYATTPTRIAGGESPFFWVDLSVAQMLTDGKFSTATLTGIPGADVTGNALLNYFPASKLQNNHVYVWSGGKGPGNTGANNGINYFGVSQISTIYSANGYFDSLPKIPVHQAYAIDAKIDDGMPLTGNVTPQYVAYSVAPLWAGVNRNADETTVAITASDLVCFNNNNGANTTQTYSITSNNGAGLNCSLSFQFK